MAMEQLFSVLPDLAGKETRMAQLRGHPDLPDGDYGLLESYCTDLSCDCRRVIITVFSHSPVPKAWATINYGWESPAFYARWIGSRKDAEDAAKPILDPFNTQTPQAPAFLRLVEWVLEDEAYVERLKRHYGLFKEAIRQRREKNKAKKALQKRRPPRRKRR